MYSDDGSLVLVFNGEIYNYRRLREQLVARGLPFRTDSDTEVVLRLLERGGSRGIQRLEGMFAFALWDVRDRELTLARDWMGQKSLYWVETPAGFAFASEIKALLDLAGRRPRTRSRDAVALHVAALPAGRVHVLRGGPQASAGAHAHRHARRPLASSELWRPRYEPKHAWTEKQIVDRLDELLAEVVREHLMSEVPLGAFLSGGIDSSLVVALCEPRPARAARDLCDRRHERAQSELAVGASGRGASTARATARDRRAGPGRAHAAAWWPRSRSRSTRSARRSTSSPESRDDSVTVALGGDGGDELFAGYDRYKGQELAEIYAHLPRALRHGLLRPLFARIPDSFGYNTLTAKLRWLDEMADSSGFERYRRQRRIPAVSARRQSASSSRTPPGAAGDLVSEQLLRRYFEDGCAEQSLDRMLHADCMTRLSENQLPITDACRWRIAWSCAARSWTAASPSSRCASPPGMKMKHRRLKYVTRRLAERYLPRAIVRRPKKGFGFPLALWLRGPLRPMMQRTIDDSRLVQPGILRREELQRMHDEHVAGRVDHNYRLWMIFNLEVFWRHFLDRESVESLQEWVRCSRA